MQNSYPLNGQDELNIMKIKHELITLNIKLNSLHYFHIFLQQTQLMLHSDRHFDAIVFYQRR